VKTVSDKVVRQSLA